MLFRLTLYVSELIRKHGREDTALQIIIGKLQKEIIISESTGEIIISESTGTGQDSLIHLLSVSLGIKYRIKMKMCSSRIKVHGSVVQKYLFWEWSYLLSQFIKGVYIFQVAACRFSQRMKQVVNFFAKMCVNVCTGKGSSHHVSNDQTGIICLSELSVLFQKEVIGVETFRLLLKYSKMLLLLFFRLLVTKKVLCLLSWKTAWTWMF